MFTILDGQFAVDDYVHYPLRVLMRILKRSLISDRIGVEDHNVGLVVGLQQAAVIQVKPRCRPRRALVNGGRQRGKVPYERGCG